MPRTRHFIVDGTDEIAFSVLACTDETADFLTNHPSWGAFIVELTADELAAAFREADDRWEIVHNDIVDSFPPDDDDD